MVGWKQVEAGREQGSIAAVSDNGRHRPAKGIGILSPSESSKKAASLWPSSKEKPAQQV